MSVAGILASPTAARRCDWCGELLRATRGRFCSKLHRQTAWRLRRRRVVVSAAAATLPIRVAYADPPYPRMSRKYYRREASYAGEVDHAALIASLEADFPHGWALSTGAYALREVLPLCPAGVRVCAWVKPNGVSRRTMGLHNSWEPLIVAGGRQRPPGVRDFLYAKPARQGGSTLMGRKPLAFCAWLFDCLGLQPGDDLVDLFPGSGVVARAWAEESRRSSASLMDVASSEPRARGDASLVDVQGAP